MYIDTFCICIYYIYIYEMVDFLLQCHTTSTPPENAQATQKNEKHPGCGACFRDGVGTLAHLNMKKDGFIPVLSLCLSVFLWRKYLNSFWFVKSEFLEHVFYHQHKWCFLSTVCNVTTFLTCLWPILEILQKNTLADGYTKLLYIMWQWLLQHR